MINNNVALFLFAVFIATSSQVLLKKSAGKHHSNIIQEYLNPSVILAYIIILLANFMAVIAYREIDLKYAPILESTTYVFILVLGTLFFKEKHNYHKVVGVLFIIIGVIVFQI